MRVIHKDSRTWSNFQQAELVKLCGVAAGRWPAYVVKELLDNAVAALEDQAIKNPMVRVVLNAKGVEVFDNGVGISDEVLDAILDFDSFGGSNRHHKLPTRGAQGNAFMTIIGIASSWEVGNVTVSRRMAPKVSLNVILDKVLQEVSVERPECGPVGQSSIFVPMPPLPWKRGGSVAEDLMATIRQFAWMNPHVTFVVQGDKFWSRPSESGAGPALGNEIQCGSVNWFTAEEFTERLAADIRARPKLKLVKWVKEFAFVSNPVVPDVTLEDVPKTPGLPGKLMGLIRSATDQKKSDAPKFEPIGTQRLEDFLVDEFQADRDAGVEYSIKTGVSSAGVPWTCEVALLQMPAGSKRPMEPVLSLNRTILYGSPTFHGKHGFEYREKVRGPWHQINGDLGVLCRSYSIDHGKVASAVVVHVTCPSPGYSGYGKQQFDTSWLSKAISECFEEVTRPIRKQLAGEARRKGAKPANQGTIQQDMFALLPRVLNEVSENGKFEPLLRQLYYAFRKEWYRQDDRFLHYGTFCAYVDAFEVQQGHTVCLKDPRGILYEPHSGKAIRLGTADVRGFEPKKWEGHTIIFIEKENLAAQMRAMRIDKRYDAIIVGSKGFAVEAIRDVLQKYKRLLGDLVKIVVLHDADPAGYMIGYDLATNLPRFGDNVDIKVIDVGLTIREAQEMGLQDEPFEVNQQTYSMVTKTMRTLLIKDPDGSRRPLLETEAYDAFIPKNERGEFHGKFNGRRIELNAMTPREFQTWVEMKLDEHGCKKVRPPDDVIDAKLYTARVNTISNETGKLFMEMMGQEIVDEVLKEIGIPSYDLDSVLEMKPEQHWEYLVTRAAQTGQDVMAAVKVAMHKRMSK